MNLTHRLAIIVVIEIIYMVATRVTIHYLPWTSVEAELIRTALRIASAIIYWWLMKPLILSRKPNPETTRSASLIIGLLLFLSVPALIGNYGLKEYVAFLFAATSVPVAIKEEFLFRGIIQNLLGKKWSTLPAVFITSTVFTAWHIGIWEPSFGMFSQIFLASILLGFIYIRTGSIALVIVLHALYDALFSFTPLLPLPINENWGVVPLLASVALVFHWAYFGKGLTNHSTVTAQKTSQSS